MTDMSEYVDPESRPDDMEYWAAVPTERFAEEAMTRVEDYYRALEETGRIALWRKAVRTYYGSDPNGGWASSAAVTYGGEQGENVMLRANHYANIIEHLVSMTTQNRLAVEARALGSGPEAASQVHIAENLVDYHLDGGLEEDGKDLLRWALLFGESHEYMAWDPDEGPTDPQAGTSIGEIARHALTPIDVIRDPWKTTGDFDWMIVRHRVNRWDYMAKYPEWAEELRAQGPFSHHRESYLWELDMEFAQQKGDLDEIFVYEFFRRPSAAMPEGRHALFIPEGVLRDGPNPYAKIPVRTLKPLKELYQPFGFSRTWDLLSLTEALDAVVSTMVTNHDAFGVQLLWGLEGDSIEAQDLSDGLTFLQSGTKPEPLQLTSISADSYKLADLLRSTMEQLSGANSVVRGNPDEHIRSGAQAALVDAVAMRLNDSAQQAYAHTMEALFNDIKDLYQRFATMPRMVEMVGHDEQGYLAEFKADDIRDIKRIRVQMGSPLLRSAAGRRDVATEMVQQKLITDPEVYWKVVTTGRLDEVDRPFRAKQVLVKRENEAMRRGQPVKTLITDDHTFHVQEHMVELSLPQVREDDAVAGLILAHIQEHAMLAANMPPDLAMLTGQEQLLALMQMMAPGAPESMPGAQGSEGAAGGPAGAMGGAPPGPQEGPGKEPDATSMPRQRLPTDPRTGQEHNPAGPAPEGGGGS